MGALEEKINRLPPGLQREVEDFVDFLLQRSVDSPPVLTGGNILSPVPEPVPPPIIMAQDLSPPSRRQEIRAEMPDPIDTIPSRGPDDRYERRAGHPSPNKLLEWID